MHTFLPGDYPVYLGNLQESFPEWLQRQAYSRVFVLTDENTSSHCLPFFLEKTGLSPSSIILPSFGGVGLTAVGTEAGGGLPAGENCKTLTTCQHIWQQMLDAKLDRRALVVNLGGGVIGDMGGFCAATWKRGVDFVQVPTTLLAMTDAAIGGKLGIDFQGVKNTIGLFKNPTAVFVDPAFLKTLPERELRSGFAEVIKHALIGDPELWEAIDSLTSSETINGHSSDWLELLRSSLAVKVRIVQEDPLEKGLRAILNFGHTIGHALESHFLQTEEPLAHGEAVAIGMICESRIGNSGKLEEVVKVIRGFFSYRPIPEAAVPAIWQLMQHDKKNAAGKVRMAVPGAEPFSMQILEPGREEIERSLLFYNELKQK